MLKKEMDFFDELMKMRRGVFVSSALTENLETKDKALQDVIKADSHTVMDATQKFARDAIRGLDKIIENKLPEAVNETLKLFADIPYSDTSEDLFAMALTEKLGLPYSIDDHLPVSIEMHGKFIGVNWYGRDIQQEGFTWPCFKGTSLRDKKGRFAKEWVLEKKCEFEQSHEGLTSMSVEKAKAFFFKTMSFTNSASKSVVQRPDSLDYCCLKNIADALSKERIRLFSTEKGRAEYQGKMAKHLNHINSIVSAMCFFCDEPEKLNLNALDITPDLSDAFFWYSLDATYSDVLSEKEKGEVFVMAMRIMHFALINEHMSTRA